MITLAIDFGTSNTVAAMARDGRAPHALEFEGSALLPSAVFLASDGSLLVGREALRSARTDPTRFEPNPKRRIDDGEILLGDAAVQVVDVIASVLAAVRSEAVRQSGGVEPDLTVLTHPAQWGSARRMVLSAAARRAGLGAVELVPEPVAAAAQFTRAPGRELEAGAAVAIYDLGGGTFDVAVVGRAKDAAEDELSVLAEGGLSDLGGLDFDQALLDHVGRAARSQDPTRWGEIERPVDASSRRASRALAEDVRAAKETLSRYAQTDVAMPEPLPDAHVTREEFEALIAPELERSIVELRETIARAGLSPQRLAGVFLVGGSSRVPLVARSIQQALGVTATALDQPETAVALGALTVPRSTDDVSTTHLRDRPPASRPSDTTRKLDPVPVMAAPAPVTSGAGRRKRAVWIGAAAAVVVIVGAVVLVQRSAPAGEDRPVAAAPETSVSTAGGAPSWDGLTYVTEASVHGPTDRAPTPSTSIVTRSPSRTTSSSSAAAMPELPEPGSRSQPVAYRQGYQAAREDPETFVPATGDQAERMIATLCSRDQRASITGVRSQDWIDGCFAGTLDAVRDLNAIRTSGPTDAAWYAVGYQTGRQHHSEIAARNNGNLRQGCSYEAHLAEVPTDDRARFARGCVDGATQAAALAVPTADRRTAPEPMTEQTPTPTPTVDPADLGLSEPLAAVACDGRFVVFVGAAVTPGAYGSDVQRFLDATPGSRYLRTDRSCSSLVQSKDGNPIYAVFLGPFSRSEACSVSAATEGSTVKQLVDSGEPLANEQC